MPAVPADRRTPPAFPLRRPGRAAWWTFWLGIALLVIGLRWYVAAHLPTYVWTRDSGSYLLPATRWLEGDAWVTSARRGPIYSLFIAAVLKAGGTLRTVADAQAALGALTFLVTCLFAWRNLPQRPFWPLAVCTLLYALYSLPIELERLIRNETLLVFFATLAFGGWFRALLTGKPGWFAASGLFTGLMQLLKGIFPVFPLIVLGTIFWQWRGKLPRAAVLAGVFFGLFLLPLVSSRLYSRLTGTTRPAEPEDGQMFYGRTAQWTYLEPDGILPDIKARIRDQAQAYADRYERTGKLDNNEIVKRTVVPTLKRIIVDERGGTLVEVNRVSWRLGVEAVAHHPGGYFRQFLNDLWYLNFSCAQDTTPFVPRQLRGAERDARAYAAEHQATEASTERIFAVAQSSHALEEAAEVGSHFQRCSRLLASARRLRLVSPVLLTTLLLPVLVWFSVGRCRLFWLGTAALWYYYLLLLSTVGRPLDRYFMPVVPLMFWTITTAAALTWTGGWGWWQRRLAPQSASSSGDGAGLNG